MSDTNSSIKRGRPRLSAEEREKSYLKRIAQQKEYKEKIRSENPEKLKEISKAWREKNREKYNAQLKVANKKYRDRLKAEKENSFQTEQSTENTTFNLDTDIIETF